MPIAGLVVPYAAGVLRRMIGRCMIDLTPGAPCLTSHVPGVFCLGTRQDPCTILHVQLRTDNLVTGQHREQHSREFIERREVRERGRVGRFDVAGLIEITRGDYNRVSGTGQLSAVSGCSGSMRKQTARAASEQFVERSISRGSRLRIEISIAGGSADQKRQAPGSARMVLAIPPRDFIAEP